MKKTKFLLLLLILSVSVFQAEGEKFVLNGHEILIKATHNLIQHNTC
jgi:hypothetical protein